jgi:pyruvate dehydrogenase E1 component beta subunit
MPTAQASKSFAPTPRPTTAACSRPRCATTIPLFSLKTRSDHIPQPAISPTASSFSPQLLYGRAFPVTDAEASKDFVMEFGKARIERAGDHCTIVTFSRMTDLSLAAAAELEKIGVSVEVINLLSLRPLDMASVVKSIKKTNHIVTVEDGWPMYGVGSEIAAGIMESDAFDHLDAPMERICGADVPMPYAKNLEDAALPQVINIVNAVKRVLNIK